jgi:hypothetical protein
MGGTKPTRPACRITWWNGAARKTAPRILREARLSANYRDAGVKEISMRLAFLMLILSWLPAYGTDFYVSVKGNDGNPEQPTGGLTCPIMRSEPGYCTQ